MGVGTGLYMCDLVKKFTFAISSPDEFLFSTTQQWFVGDVPFHVKWALEVTHPASKIMSTDFRL